MSSDYVKYGRAYYQSHRSDILAAEKEKKRWVDYYQKNKEAIAERNRQRYYTRKGMAVPEKGTARGSKPGRPPAPDNALVERFEALVAELRELAPQVVKPKKVKRAKKAPEPTEAKEVKEEVPEEPKAEEPKAEQSPGAEDTLTVVA
jgi:hypothetical protein